MLALDMLRGAAGAQPTLDLNFTSGTLDSRVTYTGASLATLTDATGAIAYKPHNLALYSEDLSNAAYNAFATTVSSGATSPPSGFTSADKLQEGSGIQLRGQSMAVVSGQRYTQICRARLAERSFLVARNQDSTRWCVVDLSNGTLYNAGSGFGVTITSVGGGWYEVACSFVSGTTGNVEQQWGISANGTLSSGSYDSYTGTAGYGLYITGIQWCQGAKAAYGKTTSAAYYGPRFTYDPVTHAALGLLVEEQRTNLLTYSEQFGNAIWAPNAASVTANAAIAPDNQTTADLISGDGTSTSHYVSYNSIFPSAAVHTFSIYAKAGTASFAHILITGENPYVQVNLTTGAIVYSSAGSATNFSASVTLSINGYWRICITAMQSSGLTRAIRVYSMVASSNIAGPSETSSAGAYFWGAQLEAGAFATSYIPTTSASVTRAADSATMTGSNFSSWFNATQGTFVFENKPPTFASSPVDFCVNSGTHGLGSSSGGITSEWNGTANLDTVNTATAGNVRKAAMSYGASTRSVCLNAGTVVTSGTVAFGATPTALVIGSNFAGSSQFHNAPIARIRYYPVALTNAQLQALTT